MENRPPYQKSTYCDPHELLGRVHLGTEASSWLTALLDPKSEAVELWGHGV